MSLPLPDTRRLSPDLIPDIHREWVESALLGPLNRFIDPVFRLLDGGLTSGNLQVQLLEKVVTIPDDWVVVGGSGAPAFKNGWANYDTTIYEAAAFRKSDDGRGEVSCRGGLKSGTANTTFFTVPSVYAPGGRSALASVSNAGAADIFGSNRVDATGDVRQVGGGQTFHSLGSFFWVAADRRSIPAACWGSNCEFTSSLRGACISIWPMGAVELNSAKQPSGGCHAGLTVPDWEEVAPTRTKAKSIRIRNQRGLTPLKTYRVTWLALGE